MTMILRWSTGVLAAVALVASGTASAQAAGGAAAVSTGFHAVSASFSSPSSGVVLGGVHCAAAGPCRAALAATSNGGKSWRSLPAPKVWLDNGSPLVSEVVSAGRQNSWLYDQFNSPFVWATHNSGGHWTRLKLPGDVQALAASASTVYAVVSRKAGDELYSSSSDRNKWARVGTFTAASASLAVLGKAVWFGGSPHLYASADGVHWHQYSFSCPSGLLLAGIAPSSSTRVAFLCAFAEGTFHTIKAVLLSVNGGKTEHLTGHAPIEGDVSGFAVSRVSGVVGIGVITPGLDYVYRSTNGGKTWAQISIAGTSGGTPLASLQFVSHTVGWLVVGGLSVPGQLLTTSNTGRSWHAVSF
jgi:hypothetical protein